ncbi:hypothetical protein [Ferrimonas sp. YFM]|uniref:hypothetical protein n=1 Tax=Ferrimonas sp. YFM TaxID=3028878 RepID=UPI00257340D4|nr:hypothetical protein [Ferrimonas sp. YFM]
MEENLIVCECHGKSVPAIVCGHLAKNNGESVGFIENSDNPQDLQAWCNACEDLFSVEQELTEKFREFNNMSVVCGKCYQEIKEKHSISI